MQLSTFSPKSAITASSLLLLPMSLLASYTSAADSKRGVSIISNLHLPDWSLIDKSAISWYWNWSPYPGSSSLVTNLTFVPQIHSLDDLEKNIAQAKSLPTTSTHLMTFNEPDGTTSSGGTTISAEDAAKAYIDSILPLRKANGGQSLISHPATTGSSGGLNWLTDFNTSCYKHAPETGCPLDFVTAHWYGDFTGLQSWVTQLDDFYNDGTNASIPIWVSELAIPKQDARATVQMMNESLAYLDDSDLISSYAWFGMFRTSGSNEWTGENVALFDKSGGLTQLGATYLNQEGNTVFKKGQKGTGGAGSLGVERALGLTVFFGWLWMLIS
ncbi:uncharacterized protein RCO7_11628 [Rhynchosporium graminicola]|uniref:Asl1-like glycosyl hydrolase catalytic domain-containing protein n=1 Tax=Rhynchosporium graminicola TaxID=2792576 RepID=A0A1E1LLM5_9HELO|nr:uncharacterized protein RCO7_11628 [Rhynchosporium commune]